ncbi:MAG: hypothetical protein A2X94_00880 [Bdellovibrionales bacterium GWB1_55_8]|nr:MAG: hypothetical protein A2X94_00880 [Bdellovibrionales bacterium GWB1_55_8]
MKHSLKYLHLSLSFLLAMTCVQVRADDSSNVLSAQTVGKSQEALLRKLAEELSPAFKEFSRDVYVYHWGDCRYQTNNNPAFPVNDEFARESVQRLILWTYRKDKRQGSDMMGMSYYASVDPVDTDMFGDCVSETRLPAKARFLDERGTTGFGSELSAMLQLEGCHETTLMAMFASGNSSPCHEIITRLALAARVSAVAYSYSGASAADCTTPEHQSAFILVNPTLAGEKYTKVFNPAHAPEDGAHETRSKIKGIYAEFAGTRRKPWPSLSASSPGDWIKEHLFGCNPDKYPEDKKTDPRATKAMPELDFNAKIPTWGVLPPIGDDCCNTASQPQDGIIKAKSALDPVVRALLNP